MKFALSYLIFVFAISIYGEAEAVTSDVILDKARALICDGYTLNKPCTNGWLKYKGHCYFFGTDKVSWSDAEMRCRLNNAHLAKIEDYAENSWILANTKYTVNDGRHILWIGGNDLKKEGEWRWIEDQSLMSFKHWDFEHNEPNNGIEENCLNLMWKNSDGRWNDNRCTEKLMYVCEKK